MKRPWSRLAWGLLFIFLLAGCRSQTNEPKLPPEQKIAVLNLQQAAQAHPQWKEVEQINAQMIILKKQELEEKGIFNKISLIDKEKSAQQLQRQVKLQEWKREKERLAQTLADKMQLQKSQIEQELQNEADKLQEEKSTQLQAYKKQLQVLYGPMIVNLQLKLQYSALSEEERTKKKAEMNQLLLEQEKKLQDKQQELSQEIKAQMQVKQKQKMEQLRTYQAEEEKKLTKELQSKGQVSEQQDQEKWQELLLTEKKNREEKITNLQKIENNLQDLAKQKAQKEKKIRQDLKELCRQIAIAKDYQVVVVNYQANISGEDITLELISRLKEH